MKTIQYADLLNTKFELGGRTLAGLDCLGVAYMVALRRFGRIPEVDLAFTDSYASVSCALERMLLSRDAGRWVKVGSRAGSACEVGDIVHMAPTPETHHVATLVWARQPKVVLNTHRRHGCYAMPLAELTDVVGVYRLRT